MIIWKSANYAWNRQQLGASSKRIAEQRDTAQPDKLIPIGAPKILCSNAFRVRQRRRRLSSASPPPCSRVGAQDYSRTWRVTRPLLNRESMTQRESTCS